MTVRFYSSVAPEKTLSGTINSGVLSITISNTIGLPTSFPYTLALDYESISEELVNVVSAAGTTLTLDARGVDGTTATSHTAGARVRHVTSARDFADSRNHENAANNIHGLGPGDDIVGTLKVQSLSNKTAVNMAGTFLDPDFNLTGANTSTFNRSPAGAATDAAISLTNGAEETFSLRNNGDLRIRNPLADDTTVNTRRFRVLMSDGTTERFNITTTGMATSIPRAGTAATNGGFKVIDPGDDVQRKSIQVRNSTDTTDRFVVRSVGAVDITLSDPTFSALDVQGAVGQTAQYMRVIDGAGTPFFFIDPDGEVNCERTLDVLNTTMPASTVLTVFPHPAQTADLQTWHNSGGSAIAKVRVNGTADFASNVTTTGIFTPAAGWTVTSQLAVVKAGIATIAIRLNRSGAPITADAVGDLTTDPALGTVAAAFRPHTGFGGEFLTWVGTTTKGSGSVVLGAATGSMAVVTFSNNNTIATLDDFHWTMSYPLFFS